MTNEQLKDLKDKLWASADQLRANSGLKSTEYATPILGLIFLRFAESKYKQHETEINAEYEKYTKDIPDNISIDVFGEIYEYFLGNFALAEGQGGGMFVQNAHYIQKHKGNGNIMNLRSYGVEKTGATVKLAKMLSLNEELTRLNSSAKELESKIMENLQLLVKSNG